MKFDNNKIASLLNKLLIEFTKSRSGQTNDDALVESKNGSVVRKYMGYAHIAKQYASLLNQFDRDFLKPYPNFHRPCFFPESIFDSAG